MKRTVFFSGILCTLLFSCKQKEAATPATPATATDSSSYLPVADLLKTDMKLVDSFAAGILRKTVRDGKKDSGYIKLEEFHQLAQQFLLPALDSTTFRAQFSENSLMDETTQQLNFIYTANQPRQMLRKVIVYIAPTLATDRVSRIYMENEFSVGDTIVLQKMTWKMKQYFYTLTIRQPKNGPVSTTMDKVIWEPEQFTEE